MTLVCSAHAASMDSDGWARKTAGPQAVPTSIGSPVFKTSSTPAPTVCVPSVIPPPFLNRPTVVANVVGICRMDARRGGGSGSVFALSSQLSSRPRGGVGLEYFRPTPPPGRGPRALKGAGWCRLMHGWYGHDAGPTGGHLLVLSGTQSPWQVELQACLPLSASSR